MIHASVPITQQHLYRARGRGDCYQNVLAICDFNMIFTYVVVGWEGTAHGARILNETLIDPEADFPMRPSVTIYVMLLIDTLVDLWHHIGMLGIGLVIFAETVL